MPVMSAFLITEPLVTHFLVVFIFLRILLLNLRFRLKGEVKLNSFQCIGRHGDEGVVLV